MKYLSCLLGILLTSNTFSYNALAQDQNSSLSQPTSYQNIETNDFWTANQLDGKALDVMRLNVSDDLDSNNVSFAQTDSWLNTNSTWRWATKTEMEAIAAFFEGDSVSFLNFNGGVWSPKGEEWNGLVKGEIQTGEGHENDADNVAWGFTIKPGFIGTVSHKHNFNTSAKGAAPMLVRVPQVQCPQDFGNIVDNVVVLQVALQSIDCPNGTIDAPFSTLIEAKAAVRVLKSQGKNIAGISVEIQSGNYQIDQGLVFNNADSGSEAAPIIYRAAAGAEVTFFGGTILEPEDFSALNDEEVIASLVDQNAAANIRQFDLTAASISNWGVIVPHGFALEHSSRIAPAMLYSNNKKMTLSRWPNTEEVSPFLDTRPAESGHTGMVSYTKVIDAGPTVNGIDRFNDINFNTNGGTFEVAFDRMQYWQNIEEVFLDGVLAKSWEWTYNQLRSVDLSSKQITLKRGELSGISANKGSYFFFENIVEEIDQPGEFYLDRTKGILFFYPTSEFEQGITILSTLEQAMISIDSAKYLSFEGINFDTGRHLAFEVTNSEHISISQCEIKNFSLGAVAITGENNEVRHCTISNVGGYGISLAGGSEAQFTKSANSDVKDTLITPVTLVPGNNIASNNTIYNFAWDQKSQVPGINLAGVGNSALYNEIYDAPHFAVLLRNSTDNTVAYNYIHDLPVFHRDDGGAIYLGIGNFPHMRGNKINNNYLENIPTNGVYIDNFSSGVEVKHNAFNTVGYRNATFSAININGGGQNIMKQNYFYDVERPMKYNKFAVNNVFDSYKDKILGIHQAFNAVDLTTTPYEKYADFVEFLTYSTTDDFKLQSSSALENLSMNKNVLLDSDANGTGVIEPSDHRWILENNRVMSSVLTEHQQQFIVLDELLTISMVDDSWRDIVTYATGELPSIIQSIINNSSYDSRIDSDGDGVVDEEDAFPNDPTETIDSDNDGIGNNADLDDDNDGYLDDEDAYPLDPNRWEIELPSQVTADAKFIGLNDADKLTISSIITLDASSSIDSKQNTLSFSWKQIDGPTVSILEKNTDQASFVVPDVSEDTNISFMVTVTNSEAGTDSAQIDALIQAETATPPQPTPSPVDKNSGSGGSIFYLLLFILACIINRITTKYSMKHEANLLI